MEHLHHGEYGGDTLFFADLATQEISNLGLAPAYAAAAGGGDKIVGPDADTFLHVKNGSGVSVTVTVATPGKAAGTGGLDIADVSVAIPAGQERMIGTFPAELYANPADAGKAAVTYSAVTTVTVGVFRARRPS